jgi:hypothetical protein
LRVGRQTEESCESWGTEQRGEKVRGDNLIVPGTSSGGYSYLSVGNMAGKNVISTVGQILVELGIAAERNVACDWVTNRSPLGDDLPAPPRLRYRLMAIHARLGGDWSRLEEKRRRPLLFDFQVDDKTLIEVDRRRHFSSSRMATLDFYDDLDHMLDVNLYKELCSKFSSAADRYQSKRGASDFPFPGGRTAQRAYFDVAKDLLSSAYGYRLIRLPAADEELIESIGLSLRVLL